ncbi:uncharacterized protein TNCV_1990941 [Trichonephila clavipes]|nr:uncharacterized protein TNCV_1990941 [Trichonephila clavipes]
MDIVHFLTNVAGHPYSHQKRKYYECRQPELLQLFYFLHTVSTIQLNPCVLYFECKSGECNAPYDSPGLIKDLDKLDTTYFPVSNFLANMLDPAARIHMEVTYEAIADAGYDASNLKGQRIGVFNATTAEDSIKMNTVDESFINLQGVRTMNPNRTTYVMDFTVNGDRYRAMITNFSIPELSNHDVQELWFQQDGTTCHTALATIDLLKDTFGDRLISRFGPVNWPPRTCDLTPLAYFLWSYVKSLVYADKPQTLDHLKITFAVLLPIYGHKCWKKSSKIGRPDWTTSEPAVAVLCQKLYLKCPSTTIDSACSSGGVALWTAYHSLKNNSCDAAVVTGCQLNLHPIMLNGYIGSGIATTTGNSRPFDANSESAFLSPEIVHSFLNILTFQINLSITSQNLFKKIIYLTINAKNIGKRKKKL